MDKPQFKMSPNDASRWQRLKARLGLKVLIGSEMLPGSDRTTALYLFKCKFCKELRVDIPHGVTEQYFRCYPCEYKHRE